MLFWPFSSLTKHLVVPVYDYDAKSRGVLMFHCLRLRRRQGQRLSNAPLPQAKLRLTRFLASRLLKRHCSFVSQSRLPTGRRCLLLADGYPAETVHDCETFVVVLEDGKVPKDPSRTVSTTARFQLL